MQMEKIKQMAKQIHPAVIENRRHLHANPELSFLEYETSAFVKKKLDEMGIGWQPMVETGIVAIIKGDKTSDNVVALRADMDALPITELNVIEYASKRAGVMHACGHDAHTSSLLGTAFILQSMKQNFGGTVKLIFQPGEEKLPGGASLMILNGVLKNPVPAVVLGQHVMPTVPCGKIAICKTLMMASMDEIRVTIHGKGGHGALPYLNIDPVVISSNIILALQQIVSRAANPFLPSVLSFGRMIADGSINVIPDKVALEGTFRTIDERWRTEAHIKMKSLAENIALAMGGTCDFNITKGYPALVNNNETADNVERFAKSYLGEDNVIIIDPMMISEDFAYYSQIIPSFFYLLGVGNKKLAGQSSLHTPTFVIDEDALEISTGLMAYFALKQLEKLNIMSNSRP